MTHYIKADFTLGAVDAKYVMFAITDGRSQNTEGAAKYGYEILAFSPDYFRLSEILVYSTQK
ncbi:MAG: hypothetical protein MJ102_07030 [Clostridia bacterium]|nr:hypothetical protein [Clostridia bacterium]